MDIYSTLNERQREAVLAPRGPLLVLAGAGSGKTRVLTYRFLHLVYDEGIKPDRILAVTFTNKAADEMKERLHNMFQQYMGLDITPPWVRTFHSASLMILRRYLSSDEAKSIIRSRIDKLLLKDMNLGSDFTVADRDDSLMVIKNIFKERGYKVKSTGDDKKAMARFLEDVSLAKRRGIYDPDKFEMYYAPDYWNLPIGYRDLFKMYHSELYASGRLDFDDLLGFAHMLLEDEKFGAKIRHLFDAVLIDEFQDVNDVQYSMGKHLAEDHGNITVVGDVQQSIYSWRGASPQYVDAFLKDFPDATVVKLDINYRSAKKIVSVANSVSQSMATRHRFSVRSHSDEDGKVQVIPVSDEYAEATQVANMIHSLSISEGIPYEEMAVLYRVNAQSRHFEEVLGRYGIPYVLVKGVSFYARKEIKDVISYLTVIHNPRDKVAWQRIINTPPRGIGSVSQDKLWKHFDDVDDISQLASVLSGKGAASFKRLWSHIVRWRKMVEEGISLVELLKDVLQGSGYLDYLIDAGEDMRRENIGELMNIMAAYDAEGKTLSEFLAEMALRTDQDTADSKDGVKLMTIHAAKGLEFDVVFLVGVEDGYMPYRRGGFGWRDVDDEEEEKRLFYVAVTRPRKHLYVTYAQYRTLWGDTVARKPSPYIEYIEYALDDESEESFDDNETYKIPADDISMLKEGDRVYSDQFGYGRVIKVIPPASIKVEFDDGTKRRFRLGMASIYKVIS